MKSDRARVYKFSRCIYLSEMLPPPSLDFVPSKIFRSRPILGLFTICALVFSSFRTQKVGCVCDNGKKYLSKKDIENEDKNLGEIMENIPISVRLCRTMDVLMKFDKVPPKLRHLSKESISNLIIRALWKNQLHSEASSTAAASVRILSTVEENLRFWVQCLPAAIR